MTKQERLDIEQNISRLEASWGELSSMSEGEDDVTKLGEACSNIADAIRNLRDYLRDPKNEVR
jgi:hypothetical protein